MTSEPTTVHDPNRALIEPDASLASETGRRDYLMRLLADFPERHASLDAWAQETHGLGGAELLAFVFSVCVLGNDCADTLERLRSGRPGR